MDEEKPAFTIDDALAEIARIAFPDPAICTGWVLVSEWLGSGPSEYWTLTLSDNNQPEWRHKGLLRHGLETWGVDDLGNERQENY
jgi:hypothetical protein